MPVKSRSANKVFSFLLVLILHRKTCHMPKELQSSIIFKLPACTCRFMYISL